MSSRQITYISDFHGGVGELRNKGLYQEIRQVSCDFGEVGDLNKSKRICDNLGWDINKKLFIRNSQPQFHAYKDRVAVEYVSKKKRARVRSDILCFESASRDNQIDAGVVITTMDSQRANSSWINADLNNGILKDYIFGVPLIIIETA